MRAGRYSGACLGGESRAIFLGCQQVIHAWRARAAATIAILLLSACSPPPPIVSADTSCERFRHISATDAQIKVFADNWEVMESYADSVVAHNIEYDKKCLMGPPAP